MRWQTVHARGPATANDLSPLGPPTKNCSALLLSGLVSIRRAEEKVRRKISLRSTPETRVPSQKPYSIHGFGRICQSLVVFPTCRTV
jgi:hypothetical protein